MINCLKMLLCKWNIHKWRRVSFGYPAYSKWPKTYSRCQRCGSKRIETHDLLGDPRPKKFSIHKDYVISEGEKPRFIDKTTI